MEGDGEMRTESIAMRLNMLTRILAAALALVFLLAACGEELEPTDTPLSTATAAPATAPPTATATPQPTATPTPPTDERDLAALIALYNATDGDNWADNTNWLSDAPLWEWYGVHTGDAGRVAALDLDDNQLSGEIPAELGNLDNLVSLDFSDNRLSGEIPAELGNLTNLEALDLSGNQLSGEIPPELSNLTNLDGLLLGSDDDNQLSGCIPAGLRDVPNNDLDTLGLPDC